MTMKGKLHIVSVNQDPGISPTRKKGAAVHLSAMRKAFRQLGAEVTEVDESDEWQTGKRLQQVFKRTPINMIYERYSLGRSTAARFASRWNIPYTLEVNSLLAEEQARWRGVEEIEKDKAEDRVTFGAASFICAISSQVSDYVLARGGRDDTICVCPNGIDGSLFKLGVDDEGRLLCKPPPDRFVLGFHGRERPWHGFEMLADVTRTLLERHHPVHLFVIGNGEFKQLSRLPSGSYTRKEWTEHEELPAYVSTFHALPLTYSPQAPCYFSPLKLMEGMACGVVPLVPMLGDLPEVVEDGVNGLVYPAGDSEALIERLVSLIGNRDLHREMSLRAASTAQSYEWTGIARKTLDRLGLPSAELSVGAAVS